MSANLVVLLSLVVLGAAIDEDKNRPVSKVITLLKDMVTQLEKEAEMDEEVYEAIGCWCETNDKEKTKSISDGEQRVADLTSAIESFSGTSARLNTETENLAKEVSKNNGGLDQATALRKKQLAEFNSEEKDMLQSISALKSAVVTLGSQHAMLQDSSASTEATIDIAVLLHDEMHKHRSVIADTFSVEQRRQITAFSKSPDSFLQSNAPASGEIFGILKQMKETFETNLGQSQKEEMTNQKAYEDMKAAKEEEISAGQSLLDTKSNELAVADEKSAVSKEDLEDTRATLAADQAFLASLKEQCAALDGQYEERTKTRQMEIQATSKALAFLSSDEAHDLFSRNFNFVQISSHRQSSRRENVATHLMVAAKKFNDPRLSTLAERARMDAFAKVKKSIQDMVENLVKEKEDEIKHKDFCIEELNNNERDIERKERDKSDLKAKIDDLVMTIDQLSKAMEVLKSEIAEMQVQMKRAGEDREKENKNFQMEIADQRATQKLLGAAMGILKGFYDKAALVQAKAGQPTAPGAPAFKKMEKNAAGGGVIGMISNIINDSKAAEAEAIRGEEQAQKGYESFVQETNASVEEKSKDLVNKSEEKGKTETEIVEQKQELGAVMGELEQLYNENADLHKSCDFILKNFDIRQTARDEEIEALKQSIAMFSGAAFSSLLQEQ